MIKGEKMRVIKKTEARKRGCDACKHVKSSASIHQAKDEKGTGCSRFACPYAKCPYTELDEFETFEEYEASLEKKFKNFCIAY